MAAPASCAAGDAPSWLHNLASAPLPKYPDETDAVRLLDEQVVVVKENGETKTIFRRAYKILRPKGRELGTVVIHYDNETRISSLRAWSIPAQGKDYEVKDKDAIETSITGGLLFEDSRIKVLRIPGADPGSVIGYEYERKERPYVLQEIWWFQDVHPVREARFILQLPPGWEFKASWVNYPEQQAAASRENQWQWSLADVPAVKTEPEMPPPEAVGGRLTLTYFPRDPAIRQKTFDSWRELGRWYGSLVAGRREPTPEIRQKVAALTSGSGASLEKMRALAAFAQRDIRYVAIEIGIGSFQPHAAREIFANRYGDCKDKVTLLSAMLKEAGIDSYYVFIHSRRGVVVPDYPPSVTFNHAILAIRLPDDVPTSAVFAVTKHDRLGRLLFFDPTDALTPLGYLPSSLQANYGLLVTEQGGELVQLPLLPPATNRLLRVGKMTLSSLGTLSGEVQEIRWGGPAILRRSELLEMPGNDRAKVLESFLSRSLGGFILTGAQVGNLEKYDDNLVLNYSFMAENYAKIAGPLLLVRPRVLGQKSTDLLERKERRYPVEFPAASLETDTFEIALPIGYEVDELPPPVSVDFGFAAYQSKVEVSGTVLRYSRTYQVKEVFVPTQRLDELKRFYRQIAADERTSAVLRRSAP
jgi:hypothetical protein